MGALEPHSGPTQIRMRTEAGAWACSWRGAPNQAIIDSLAGQEPKAERSLMHRFNIGQVSFTPCAQLPRTDTDDMLIAHSYFDSRAPLAYLLLLPA